MFCEPFLAGVYLGAWGVSGVLLAVLGRPCGDLWRPVPIFDRCWVSVGSLKAKVGSILAINFQTCFCCDPFADGRKESQIDFLKGGRCTILQCLWMFCECWPGPFWVYFGFHVGFIWGPNFATILLVGCPGGQSRHHFGMSNLK